MHGYGVHGVAGRSSSGGHEEHLGSFVRRRRFLRKRRVSLPSVCDNVWYSSSGSQEGSRRGPWRRANSLQFCRPKLACGCVVWSGTGEQNIIVQYWPVQAACQFFCGIVKGVGNAIDRDQASAESAQRQSRGAQRQDEPTFPRARSSATERATAVASGKSEVSMLHGLLILDLSRGWPATACRRRCHVQQVLLGKFIHQWSNPSVFESTNDIGRCSGSLHPASRKAGACDPAMSCHQLSTLLTGHPSDCSFVHNASVVLATGTETREDHHRLTRPRRCQRTVSGKVERLPQG